MINHRMNKLNYALLQAFLCLYVAERVYPPITTYFPSVYVVLGCVFGWLFISFASDTQYYIKCSGRLVLILFCYVYTIFMPRMAGNGMIGNRYMGMTMVFFGTIVYNFHKRTGTLRIVRNALIVAAVFSVITAVTTTKALIENPYISRSIKSSGEHSENLAAMGIGGYNFIYYGTMLIPVLLHMCINSKQAWQKISCFALLAFDIFMILKSSYMTAIMLMAIMMAVYIVSMIINSPQNRGFKLLMLLCGVILFVLVAPILFENLLEYLPPRIQQIFSQEESQSFVDSLYAEFIVDRWPEWLMSIDAVKRNPLLGIAVSGRIATSNGFLLGFGQHSFVLDTLALYGVVVGIAVVIISLFPILKTNDRLTLKQRPIHSAMTVGIVLMYLFNNATDSIAFASSIVFLYTKEKYR